MPLQLSEVILSIVSMMMDVEKKTLTDAQMHDQACTRYAMFTCNLNFQRVFDRCFICFYTTMGFLVF